MRTKATNADAIYEALLTKYNEDYIDAAAESLAIELEVLMGHLAAANNKLRDIFATTSSLSFVANFLADGISGQRSSFFTDLKALMESKVFNDSSRKARMAMMLADELYEMQSGDGDAYASLKGTVNPLLQGWGFMDWTDGEQQFWDAVYLFDHKYGFDRNWSRDDFFGFLSGQGFGEAYDMDEAFTWDDLIKLVKDYETKLKRGYFSNREDMLQNEIEGV